MTGASTGSDEDMLRSLHEVHSITDVLNRYVRGVDRRDWDMVRASYHDHAHIHQGDYKGGIDGLIEDLRRRQEKIDRSMHVIGNSLIEFAAADRALAETYWIAFQQLGSAAVVAARSLVNFSISDDESVVLEAHGRWIDEFEHGTSGWRIARRTVVMEGTSTRIVEADRQPTTMWAQPSRGRDDPLYAARRRLGLAG